MVIVIVIDLDFVSLCAGNLINGYMFRPIAIDVIIVQHHISCRLISIITVGYTIIRGDMEVYIS